jgi:hypothetical protein
MKTTRRCGEMVRRRGNQQGEGENRQGEGGIEEEGGPDDEEEEGQDEMRKRGQGPQAGTRVVRHENRPRQMSWPVFFYSFLFDPANNLK